MHAYRIMLCDGWESLRYAALVLCAVWHMQTAIAGRKRELQSEQQELEAVLAAGTAAGLHPLDQPDIQPAVKVCSSKIDH